MIVHLLSMGRSLCGRPGVPKEWPPDHFWIDFRADLFRTNQQADEVLQAERCAACWQRRQELRSAPFTEPGRRTRIYEALQAERERQDKKWGGPEHDDEHTVDDWSLFIRERTDALTSSNAPAVRRALIEIAALAVAAIESIDRKAGR